MSDFEPGDAPLLNKLRERLAFEARRGRRFIGRTRLYQPVFGWKDAARHVAADVYIGHGTTVIDWPGYRRPFHLRRGGSDLHTFVHVIAQDAYKPDFDEPSSAEVIIDAGANVGLAALWYAEKYPDAKILAIEPEAENFEWLQRNVEAYPNIRPIQAALWNECGSLSITDTGGGSWAFRVDLSPADGASTGTDIAAITIESLMKEHDVDHIDILKIDVEGSEKEVFEASDGWIGDVDMIAVELHDRFKAGCSDAFNEATREFSIRSTRDEETFVRRPATV